MDAIRSVYSSNLDAQEKRNQCGELLRKLVPLIGTERAIQLLDDVIGPGFDRDVLVGHAFEWSNETTAESMKILRELSGTSFNQGYAGLATRLIKDGNTEDLRSLLGSDEPSPSWESIKVSMSVGLANLSDPDESRQLFDSLTGLLKSLPESIQPDYLSSLVSAGARRHAFAAWDIIIALKQGGGLSPQIERAIKESESNLVATMVHQNPKLALERLRNGGEDEANLLSVAIGKWLGTSEAAALRWLDSEGGSMNRIQKDYVGVALSSHLATQGDFVKGWERIEAIVDPDLRKKAEGRVWGAERELVRKNVNQNPEAAIQSLVSGQPAHAAYWIEEAMMTWISKEPENAEKWYEKNWNSLPPEKSQYVAAAYAKEALRLGDTATARQWTNLIQDPKTRDRIVESIDKAGAAPGQ